MLRKIGQAVDLIRRLRYLDRSIEEIKINQGRILAGMQRGLSMQPIWQHEFKVFSQWGEDGIIQFLVNNINIENCTFIEFGIEDFSESNCRFLMMNNHWSGYVIDGLPRNIDSLRSSYYYWQNSLNSKASFITRENVNGLLAESGFEKNLGILSIDIDGVDYHVLESLKDWRPSILIVEYNDAFGWVRPVSVPYDPAFVRAQKHPSNQYWGANLPAFVFLTSRRGYALVGVNGVGSNAFFVRRDLLNDYVHEVSMDSCVRQAAFRDSRNESGELTFLSGVSRTKVMVDMPLVDVSTGESLCVGDLLV